MPQAAPATPAQIRAVSLLSKALYVTPLSWIVLLLDGARKAVGSTGGLLIYLFFIFAVSFYFVWVFNSWIQALIGRPGKLSLEKSGRQMNGWMIVAIICYVLSTLGAVGQVLVQLGSSMTSSSGTFLGTVVSMLINICALIGVVAARTWFSRGYVLGFIPQRRPLLWSIWVSNALTVVFLIDRVVYLLSHPNRISSEWTIPITVFTTVAAVITGGLIANVIQQTFGVERETSEGSTSVMIQ